MPPDPKRCVAHALSSATSAKAPAKRARGASSKGFSSRVSTGVFLSDPAEQGQCARSEGGRTDQGRPDEVRREARSDDRHDRHDPHYGYETGEAGSGREQAGGLSGGGSTGERDGDRSGGDEGACEAGQDHAAVGPAILTAT